jgi:hypothetical protein
MASRYAMKQPEPRMAKYVAASSFNKPACHCTSSSSGSSSFLPAFARYINSLSFGGSAEALA